MESAIPEHLRCPRTRLRRAPETYVPAFASWAARMGADVTRIVIAHYGIQWREAASTDAAHATMDMIIAWLKGEAGPGHHELVRYVDEAGFQTLTAVAYWDDIERFGRWQNDGALESWFRSDDRLTDGHGYFREILWPSITHVETLFSSSDKFEGAAVLARTFSGEIREHGYWGGMRDRIPASQTDALVPCGSPRIDGAGTGRRVRIQGHDNLALIHSGQDWSETAEGERERYLGGVEPILRAGMDFLRDHGLAIGCYFNRYVTLQDEGGLPREKSFAVSAWRSLEHLERWAESHPTHLAIFDSFMRIVQPSGAMMRLRLFHEVVVAKASEQTYEYVNCHSKTGLMRAVE